MLRRASSNGPRVGQDMRAQRGRQGAATRFSVSLRGSTSNGPRQDRTSTNKWDDRRKGSHAEGFTIGATWGDRNRVTLREREKKLYAEVSF
jgi:hypothetical protein